MTNTTRSLRSRLSRRLRCMLVALVLTALLLPGAVPATAQSASDHWFQWGPARPPSIDGPLANPDVQQALYLAVDENAVSQRVLGKPSLVMETEDASYPQEFYEENEFEPWKARIILEDDGITDLALTIAPDPSVPEARALAQAVADELRKNIGAQVTVVEGDADLLVTRSLGKSPSAAPGTISLETSCTPDTFRPNEWTVVECESTVKNSGQADLIYNLVVVQDDPPGPGVMEYAIVSGERNEKSETAWGRDLSPAKLAAGETAVHRRLMLLQATAEGTYEFSARVIVARDVPASVPLHFTASSQASPSPSDLEVTRQLTKRWAADGYQYASFETKITNRGSQTATDLRVTDRNDDTLAYVSERQPPPDYQDESGQFVSWSSFPTALAPGASMALQTVFRSTKKEPYLSVNAAGMVEAEVGGTVERYAAPATLSEGLSGGCGDCGGSGGGASPAADTPSSLGHEGDGPGGSGRGVVWTATLLAVGGAVLIGGGLALPRRAGRHGLPLLVALVMASLLPSAGAHAQPMPIGRQAPTPPAPPSTVSLGVTCSPDIFPPDQWVVVECATQLTNRGENPVSDVGVNIGAQDGWSDDPLPNYYWISHIRDGRMMPISGQTLGFDSDDVLQPGQTIESRLTVLLRMREGTWHGQDTLSVDGQQVLAVPVQFTASADAPTLPDNFLIIQTFSNVSAPGVRVPTVTYETKITNQGSSPVTNLKITEHADNATLLCTNPAPSERNDDLGLVSWDLTSFGAGSLIPGESLILHSTYGPFEEDSCIGMSAGTVVEADVDGTTERYGVGPNEFPLVGKCPDFTRRPAMSDSDLWVLRHDGALLDPVAPAGIVSAGDGPAGRTFDFIWVAFCFAAAGAGLVAAALVARRRLRS